MLELKITPLRKTSYLALFLGFKIYKKTFLAMPEKG